MGSVTRRSGRVRVQLADHEVAVLTQLIDELDVLIAPEQSFASPADEADLADPGASEAGAFEPGWAADTSFAAVVNDIGWPASASVEVPDDPAMRRLLPDAYSDDPVASAEFRRYTDGALREAMAHDTAAVRLELAGFAGGSRILTEEDAHSWLRVLTRLRLVLASRLGIQNADDVEALADLGADDPAAAAAVAFEWLGDLLQALLRAMRRGGH